MIEFLHSELGFALVWGWVKAVVVVGAVMSVVPFVVLYERKLLGWVQVRPGPNRVGPWGLLQGVADGLKLFFKEDVIPRGADKLVFVLAPALLVVPTLLALAIVPFGDVLPLPASWTGGRELPLVIADLDVGVLFLLAITSLGVYGIALAGWSSNSKYPLLGSVRAGAQMISYEVSWGLAVLSVVLLAGTLSLPELIALQSGPAWNWFVFQQPVACVVFLVAALAENNRLPFDLAEAEQELTGGYHTEYSSMKFALFFLAEYIAMIVMGGIFVTLFFGGWQSPFGFYLFRDSVPLLYTLETVFWWALKVFVYVTVFILIRGTLPRLRYDQLMDLGWKVMLPLVLVNVAVTAVCVALLPAEILPWVLFGAGVVQLIALDVLVSRRDRRARRYAVPGVEVQS